MFFISALRPRVFHDRPADQGVRITAGAEPFRARRASGEKTSAIAVRTDLMHCKYA